MGNANGWVHRVQRHKGRSRLHHTEHGDDDLFRSLKVDADEGTGTDTVPAEEQREPGRPPIKFAVCEHTIGAGDGGSLGSTARLRHEQLVRTAGAGVVRIGVVPGDKHTLPVLG